MVVLDSSQFGRHLQILFVLAPVSQGYFPDCLGVVEHFFEHRRVQLEIASQLLFQGLADGLFELGVPQADDGAQFHPFLPDRLTFHLLYTPQYAVYALFANVAVLEEPQDVETADLVHLLLHLAASFGPPGQDGQNELLVDDPQLEILVLVAEELADFADQADDFFTNCALGEGDEEIADILFSQVGKEIAVDVAEVRDIFFQQGEGVDEEEDVGGGVG